MLFQLLRRFHTCLPYRAAESSLLAKLRKKTGYTIANCKKALEMHNNDTDKAEAWLNEQAQAMGWAKATKLAGRAALQGLVAVKCDSKHGVLVEVNCETDFVAKNDKFQQMLEDATAACFKFAHSHIQAKGPITKLELDSEQLGNLTTEGGKKLSEMLALFIGSVGENAVLRRAACWRAGADGVRVAAYTHPAPPEPAAYSTGKYGALLAYTQPPAAVASDDAVDLGRQICQHIVGLAPTKIGDKETDEPNKDADNETCLIYQEYLLDPSVTVGELLEENNIKVIDYVRFACGEVLETKLPGVEKQPLDTVQTLQ